MHLEVLAEPELEFGAAARHIDPRFGISWYGPADRLTATAPSEIKVGVVGTATDTDGLVRWLERCRDEVGSPAGKAERMLNLFPPFPGFAPDRAFFSTLRFDARAQRDIRARDLAALGELTPADAARQAVELYLQQIQDLVEDNWCDVIICCHPDLPQPPDGQSRAAGEVNFHDLLKAAAMPQGRPLQVIRRTTWGDTSGPKSTRRAGRSVQDEATRAWNLHTALYYKAGGVPWRMRRDSAELSTCYVGIGFYRDTVGEHLDTAVAQVFNQRGDGVVVRGGVAAFDKDDRQPHLSAVDAQQLLHAALQAFRREHKTLPARCVVHKTSNHSPLEVDGFQAAADAADLHSLELLWISRTEHVRLFRPGHNPPLRGTLLQTGTDRAVLYTRGTVPFYASYPGQYVPAPLGLRIARADRSPRALAEEVLALTKMNWNQTQLDARDPITLRTSQQVGDILRFLAAGTAVNGSYAYYM